MKIAFRKTAALSLCLLVLCAVGCTEDSYELGVNSAVESITVDKVQESSDNGDETKANEDSASATDETKADEDAGWSGWIS